MSFVYNELTDKCNITILAGVPNYKVRNKLNFRVHSIELRDGTIVRDPSFTDSLHVFPIKNALVGKKIQFNFTFLKSEIKNVKKFKIGFCDEMVRWLDSTILTFENTFFSNEPEEVMESKVDFSESNEVITSKQQEENSAESFALLEQEINTLMAEFSAEVSIRELSESKSSDTLTSDLIETRLTELTEQSFVSELSLDIAESPKVAADVMPSGTNSNRKQRRNKKK